jgi:hypothetical protein
MLVDLRPAQQFGSKHNQANACASDHHYTNNIFALTWYSFSAYPARFLGTIRRARIIFHCARLTGHEFGRVARQVRMNIAQPCDAPCAAVSDRRRGNDFLATGNN